MVLYMYKIYVFGEREKFDGYNFTSEYIYLFLR